eukprot:TRINITY_DN1695_c0_g2_i9.p1 TRINITY_DN1695_c0_g2~~TRINITY_DN1695_c0_g2_i9.p1  ORF type:complete len:285 (+),score=36.28 TRINITY_DN1695_c0_g2_i9:73-927(+)
MMFCVLLTLLQVTLFSQLSNGIETQIALPLNGTSFRRLTYTLEPRPTSRTGANIAVNSDGSTLILIGGESVATDVTIWSFNLTGFVWSKTSAQLSVTGSCAVQQNDVLYIYGGRTLVDNTPSNKLYKYDLARGSLTQISTLDHPTDGVSCALVKDELYLFGGGCTNAATVFSLTSQTSKSLTGSMLPPAPVMAVSSLQTENEVFLWGGAWACGGSGSAVWRLDIEKQVWAKDEVGPRFPSNRTFFNAVLDQTSTHPQILIFGGLDASSGMALSDTWSYDTVEKK